MCNQTYKDAVVNVETIDGDLIERLGLNAIDCVYGMGMQAYQQCTSGDDLAEICADLSSMMKQAFLRGVLHVDGNNDSHIVSLRSYASHALSELKI